MNTNEKIRFDQNKNTLATIREGDTIFFGISRCNAEAGDIFEKKRGRMIAYNRAKLAQKEGVDRPAVFVNDEAIEGGVVTWGRWGIRGACHVSLAYVLMQYFRDTDDRLYLKSSDYRRLSRNSLLSSGGLIDRVTSEIAWPLPYSKLINEEAIGEFTW